MTPPDPFGTPWPDAVLFDFDGVLVESVAVKGAAFAALYRPYGEEVANRVTAHHAANGGMSRYDKFRHYHAAFLGSRLAAAELEALDRRFSALVEDAVAACPWVPGARGLLDRLAGRRPLFVVSATPPDELRRIVARRGIDGCFVEVLGGADKAALVGGILERHRLDPARLLLIGDAEADRRAAAAHGVRFLGRVPPGAPDPFPSGTPSVPDLQGLAVGPS